MKMPASFAEFSDALQKARIKDGSFCKNELTCIHYNGLTHAMIGWNANLYDLNLFAQRLASLTEEQKKGMDALLKIKQNHRVAPIPLNQLINLTYNTDICCFAPRVSNHEELGAFLYANEMLSNEAMALLDTTEEGSGFQERLLELLGEQHQEDHGGVFTDFGYAELGGEIKDIYVCQSNETACFHRSDAPVVLELEDCHRLDLALDLAQNLQHYEFFPRGMDLAAYGRELAVRNGVIPPSRLITDAFDGAAYAEANMGQYGLSTTDHGYVAWNGGERRYEYSQPEHHSPALSI